MKSKDQRAQDIFKCKSEIVKAIAPILDKYEIMDVDLLSLLAYMTGETIALLDKNDFSPEQAMQHVILNIQLGNMNMIQAFGVPPGTQPN